MSTFERLDEMSGRLVDIDTENFRDVKWLSFQS